MTMKINLLQGYILAFILSQSLLRIERIVVPTRMGPKKRKKCYSLSLRICSESVAVRETNSENSCLIFL